MNAYYNEIDPYCCQWLRNLIAVGHIPAGDVDERSIVDVQPDDLRGYTQAHFFAGIGGWAYALRLSLWPDDRPVWTGSCPCQPFSAAGKGKASGDERHLWPEWFRLIRAVRPPVIFGEQVEAAIGWGWLDLVHTDMEAEGYTVGAAVLPACSVGAPHIRQRLWFVAEPNGGDKPQERASDDAEREQRTEVRRRAIVISGVGATSGNGELANTDATGRSKQRRGELLDGEPAQRHNTNRRGVMGNTDSQREGAQRGVPTGARVEPARGAWSDLKWLPCTDGKQRPTAKSYVQPLAHGIPGRVAKLRAAGNAIVPQVAAQFVQAVMECE